MTTSTAVHPHTATLPDVRIEDAGKLLLRLSIGVLMLLHGVAKIKSGPGPIMDLLAQHGLPGVLAYLAYLGEVVAPLLMIVGMWTRPAALVVVINMVIAISLAHADQFLTLGKQGGWAIELQGLYLAGALVIALLGAGRISIGAVNTRWN